MHKNLQIQSIRGIWCLIIVLYHLLFRYNQLFAEESILSSSVWNILAGLGVISFFVISGYYLAKPQEGNFIDITKHYFKRFLNIYIPYVCSVLIIFFVDKIGYCGTIPSFYDLLKNLIFVQYFTGNFIDGAHWYVVILVLFLMATYLMNIISAFLKNKIGLNFDWYFIFILTYSLLSLFAVILTKYELVTNVYIIKLLKILFYNQFPKIVLGFSLFYILNHVYFYVIPCFISWVTLILVSFDNIYIVPIVLLILSLCFMKKIILLEKTKFLITLGDMSYSIYLMHQNIGYTLENVIIRKNNFVLAFSISFVLSITIGIIFYFLVESKTKSKIRKLFIKKSGEEKNVHNSSNA